jgi:hypothetical protein
MVLGSATFLKKIGSRTQSDPKFSQRGGGVSCVDARIKRFWNVFLACVHLRKNFRNGVLAHSITKIPVALSHLHARIKGLKSIKGLGVCFLYITMSCAYREHAVV